MITISDTEFYQIRDIMYKNTGVFLRETKKELVISRLITRLEKLKFTSFQQYISYLKDSRNRELELFVNAITTTETYFFRCEKQFDILKNKILPEIIEKKSEQGNKTIQIWSAGCSNGAEPYSIAIMIKEYFPILRDWVVPIYATDVNSEVLAEAKQGVYRNNVLRAMPAALKKKYFNKRYLYKEGK